jgi:SAM-dependent methyltransferase
MPEFYDELAPLYHLIYPDWEASMRRQGAALEAIIRARSRPPARTVLDAACGIGTQSLALGALGFEVTGSDLSPTAVHRAAREAAARGLVVPVRVADMREAFAVHRRTFDAVIACDNALPHLLTNADILKALRQLFLCTAPGGICLVSVRDYDTLERGGMQVHPHGVRRVEGSRYFLFQVWEWEGDRYETTLYVVEHPADAPPMVRSMAATYYAVGIGTLTDLMREAGFDELERIDEAFFQPILVGRRPAGSGSPSHGRER